MSSPYTSKAAIPPRITHAPTHKYQYPAANYDGRVNNPKFVQLVLAAVQKRLGRYLNGNESAAAIQQIRAIDPHMIANQPVELVLAALCDTLVERIASGNFGSIRGPTDAVEGEIDIHELMRQQIGTSSEQDSDYKFGTDSKEHFGGGDINSVFGIGDIAAFTKTLNPQARLRQNYIVLDSRYRIPTVGPIAEFTWDFMSTLTSSPGTVNIYGVIRDIIAMRVEPVRLPYVLGADTNQRLITMNIKELAPQGYVAHENRRYHFTFRSTIDVNWIDCTPFNYNDGYYRFNKSITKLDHLTVSFGSPLAPIVFDTDRDNYTMVYGALTTTVITTSPHNLVTGDVVYFDDFTTLAPVVDGPTIQLINASDGHFVTFVGPTVFTINVNTIAAAPVPPALRPTVYYGSKRLFINIELTYIEPDR